MVQHLKSTGNMAIKNVEITVSQLLNDLSEGGTWLKKDDLGYGSIEVKYGASPMQIAAIRKHPALKDAETSLTIFNIIDDTKNDNTTSTEEPISKRTDNPVEQPMVAVASNGTTVAATEAADIFANL
jgi:hypothetical protein